MLVKFWDQEYAPEYTTQPRRGAEASMASVRVRLWGDVGEKMPVGTLKRMGAIYKMPQAHKRIGIDRFFILSLFPYFSNDPRPEGAGRSGLSGCEFDVSHLHEFNFYISPSVMRKLNVKINFARRKCDAVPAARARGWYAEAQKPIAI